MDLGHAEQIDDGTPQPILIDFQALAHSFTGSQRQRAREIEALSDGIFPVAERNFTVAAHQSGRQSNRG